MPRGFKVSHLLIVNLVLFVNISKFFEVNLFIRLTFSVSHWDIGDDVYHVYFSMQLKTFMSIHFSQLVDHCVTLLNILMPRY
jgi:hypothetical protein